LPLEVSYDVRLIEKHNRRGQPILVLPNVDGVGSLSMVDDLGKTEFLECAVVSAEYSNDCTTVYGCPRRIESHVLFEPQDFMARLAALVPRPKAHLVRYHGLFAPNARERAGIVARPKAASKAGGA
jgi:hypothetical protein